MGCAGGRVHTVEVVSKIILIALEFDPNFEIRKKITSLIKNSPWYNSNMSKLHNEDMETFMNDNEIDKLSKKLMSDILLFAEEKLHCVYPEREFKKNVLLTSILFLSRNNQETESHKRKLLSTLIENTKVDALYRSGKFSFLITNIVHYFCYIFVKFILIQAVLLTFEGWNRGQMETFFIQGEKVEKIEHESFNEYFKSKLQALNSKISPEAVLNLCLPYIFDPIKSCTIMLND